MWEGVDEWVVKGCKKDLRQICDRNRAELTLRGNGIFAIDRAERLCCLVV